MWLTHGSNFFKIGTKTSKSEFSWTTFAQIFGCRLFALQISEIYLVLIERKTLRNRKRNGVFSFKIDYWWEVFVTFKTKNQYVIEVYRFFTSLKQFNAFSLICWMTLIFHFYIFILKWMIFTFNFYFSQIVCAILRWYIRFAVWHMCSRALHSK